MKNPHSKNNEQSFNQTEWLPKLEAWQLLNQAFADLESLRRLVPPNAVQDMDMVCRSLGRVEGYLESLPDWKALRPRQSSTVYHDRDADSVDWKALRPRQSSTLPSAQESAGRGNHSSLQNAK
jgi:hypothetical protein